MRYIGSIAISLEIHAVYQHAIGRALISFQFQYNKNIFEKNGEFPTSYKIEVKVALVLMSEVQKHDDITDIQKHISF